MLSVQISYCNTLGLLGNAWHFDPQTDNINFRVNNGWRKKNFRMQRVKRVMQLCMFTVPFHSSPAIRNAQAMDSRLLQAAEILLLISCTVWLCNSNSWKFFEVCFICRTRWWWKKDIEIKPGFKPGSSKFHSDALTNYATGTPGIGAEDIDSIEP